MATAASIRINGNVPPQEVPLTWPVATPIQFTNIGAGGEVSWLWQILDQPEGAADSLSNPNIANPTLLPKKEGTYLIKLTVNLGLADEKSDTQIAYTLDVKTRERKPAAGERLEESASRGWAQAMNRYLDRLSDIAGDPGVVVGVAGQIGLQANISVVTPTSSVTIKTGFSGEESVPSFQAALATNLTHMSGQLYVVIGGVDGAAAPANGALIRVRHLGLILNAAGGGGAAVGDRVYVSDIGQLSWFTPGTIPRQIAQVVKVNGAQVDIMVSGATLTGTLGDSISWGNTSTRNDAEETVLDLGYEDRTAPITANSMGVWIAERPGRLVRMRVVCDTGPIGDAQVFTVQKNGVNQTLSASLVAAATSVSDMAESHAVTFTTGDLIRVTCTGGGALVTGSVRTRVTVGRMIG